MSQGWNRDAAGVMHPLLFECDREGRVVWMSTHARAVVGERPLRAAMADYLSGGGAFRVWQAFRLPETLLFAAQAEGACEAPVCLADQLLSRCFLLEKAERRLAVSAAARNGRARRRAPALHQVERERQRLGRELHTGVGQMLVAIRLQLEVIATQMPHPAEAVQRALAGIGRLSEEALQQVRGISQRLYPPEWQRLTIDEALRQLWETAGIAQRFEGSLRLERPPREPAQEIKVALYRAAQEALSNIARHSGASRVEMTLETLSDRIVLTMRDDGKGFARAVAGGGSSKPGAAVDLRRGGRSGREI